ncbi:methyltransferase domain-containing protein [Parendozoicomonas haliclonae]|uniref:tRNA 5-carboxymethoxyuridine methyltransferase n=1 Tax=Parendozoicomonas haliclonae TaxID=1960125 RepID=A0A1X7AI63_9GAMM|nr:methyltransferase domain-containing protein [Parendozoicomonas haliclonae]SMA42537.1 putative S-adenosyl-L-methionine-dependent methyltransferase [Parendozoicomonas haliclonae]
MLADRNFDTLADRFERQIYGTDKGRLRTELIREDLSLIPWLDNPEGQHIIDAGGGTGLFSAQLSQGKALQVSLCDLSAEMLKRAERNFSDIAPETSVNIIHAPIQELAQHQSNPGDLILFHAVIEWLADPKAVFEQLAQQVKPGGWYSVLFYNKRALIWRHLMMGNFVYTNNPGARLQGNGKTLTPDNPQILEDVEQWIEEAGLEVKAKTGIRAVYDNMRPHDLQRSSFADILEAERIYGRQKPYLDMARYIHILCRKPD